MTQARKKSDASNQALEMRMREVLDGLEEMACYISYQAIDESFEILSIDRPPIEDPVLAAERASVHPISVATPKSKSTAQNRKRPSPAATTKPLAAQRQQTTQGNDIAAYLIAREQRLQRHG